MRGTVRSGPFHSSARNHPGAGDGVFRARLSGILLLARFHRKSGRGLHRCLLGRRCAAATLRRGMGGPDARRIADHEASPFERNPAATGRERNGRLRVCNNDKQTLVPGVCRVAVSRDMKCGSCSLSVQGRGHSVGCQINNAKGEPSVNKGDHAACRTGLRLRERLLVAAVAALSQRKSPEKPMCSQVKGVVCASSASAMFS